MEDPSPDLRIVPLNTLVLHESREEGRRRRLKDRMEDEGVLRNPLIVTPTGKGDLFLVLDGVHRYYTLKDFGCRDALVQVVDYNDEGIQLHTWCRLVLDLKDFLEKTEKLGLKIEKTEEENATRVLEAGEAYGYVRDGGEYCIIIRGNNPSIKDKTDKLQEILDLNGGLPRVQYQEIDGYIKSGDAEGGFILGAYTKKDVLELARLKTKLPAGTTRHIIPGRVLGVNIRLDFLKTNIPTEEKNKLLYDRIIRLEAERRVRYYPESVWLFDE